MPCTTAAAVTYQLSTDFDSFLINSAPVDERVAQLLAEQQVRFNRNACLLMVHMQTMLD